MKIPEKIMKTFKNHKLSIAVKESKMAFFESNMYKTDISFMHFVNQNELTKALKFDKVKFDVIVRIRQAIGKKEMETVTEETLTIQKIYTPFNEYTFASKAGAVKKQENPMITVAKDFQKMQDPKPVPVAIAKPKQVEEAKQSVAVSVPSNITDLDIRDVENQGLLKSVAYCEFRIKECDSEIKKSISQG